MKIITITLNPAFDIHYRMEEFKLHEHNYVDTVLTNAGGKGINISRALSKNNIDNTAYIILGKENAAEFLSQLETESINGINIKKFYCTGRIRENITIHTPCEPETRISRDDFYINPKMLNQLLKDLLQVVDEKTIITFTGRIPKGMKIDDIIYFLKKLKSHKCLLVIDCNSFSLDTLVNLKPWLIKPNMEEIQELIGEPIDTIEQVMEVATEIHKTGIQNVIISMGREGAAAALSSGINCIAEVPNIVPLSTIGAGDSLIAGFIGAYVKKLSYEDCFINAVSYGTAACLTQGTAPPEPHNVEKIKQEVRLRHHNSVTMI